MNFTAISIFYNFQKNIISLIFLFFCLSQLKVQAQPESNLSLTKTVDKTIANVNDLVTFTITIKNNGPANANNVRVTDVLASGYTFVSATPSIGTWSEPIWSVGNMVKDATASMVLVAKVSPFGNYTNTAAIKADESDPNLLDNHSKISLGVIRAIDDYLYVNSTTGGQEIGNVLINDFLNGYLAKIDNINITQITTSDSKVTLNVTTGKINVEPNTPPGNYSIVYQIIDKSNAALSATGTVNINVNNNNSGASTLPIEAKNDEGFIEVGKSGIALFNVLANDYLAGGQATTSNVTLELVSVTNPNITLDLSSGSVIATDNIPLGVYTLVYKITSKADAAITATGSVTINVNLIGTLKVSDDFGTVDELGGVAVVNVLDNDLLNGAVASLNDVTLETVYVQPGSGLTLDITTGEVTAPAGTPNGVYTLSYKVTEKAVPTSFALADAIVTVTGGVSLIEARDDSGVINGTNGGVAIENVLANDDLEGAVPLLSQVNLSQTAFNNSNGNVNLDFTTGRVIVNPGTPNGTFTLGYLIEDKSKPGSSSYADANVTVTGGMSLVTAIEDQGVANGDIGGIAVANVLLNDDFKGAVPLISEVNLTQSFSNNPGIRLDESTGQVIVDAGTKNGVYTIAYSIQDKNDPESSSYADVIISVTEGVPNIIANADTGTANGTTGGIAVSNVLANDTLGVVTPNIADINLTQISSTHLGVSLTVATGEVVIAMGTPVGTYVLEYQIEDKANPGNISTASVTVTVTKTSQVIANDDTGKIHSSTGGIAIANVLANDILEGATPHISQVIITQLYSDPGLKLDTNTGSVIVEAGTPIGFWTITYQIEDKANLGSTSIADAVIEVTDNALPLVATNDLGVVDGIVGGIAIPDVLTNDTYNGLPVTIADVDIILDYNPEPKISLDIATGGVNVAPNTPAGVYALVYTIKDKSDPANTATAYIEVTVTNNGILAKDDSGSIDGEIGGVAVANVLANDILDGITPLINQVNLREISSNHAGVTLDTATGEVSVTAGTPAGTYTLVYQIEDKANPAKISTANVVVTVTKTALITANDDGGKVNSVSGGVAVANVLANDDLRGVVPLLSQVNIIQTYTNHPNINLDPLTASVKVLAGTPVGFYTVTYQIEDKANLGNTSLADAIIEVTDDVLPLIAADDKGTIDGLTGGVVIPDILANDTFNGLPATIAEVDIVLDYNPEPKITLDVAKGEVNVASNTPAGVYTLVYTIKDKLNPVNIATAFIELTVIRKILIANDDNGTINGVLGGTVVHDVLVNDTLNGNPVTLTDVDLTEISSSHPNITLDPLTGEVEVAPGAPAGIFHLVYRITDKTNPSNLTEARVKVTVINPMISAVDDSGSVNGLTGGEPVANILSNDTFNGATATLAEVNLTQISSSNKNINIETATGKVIVAAGTSAGIYTLIYSITDKANAANTAIANVLVTVTNQTIAAINDNGGVSSAIGGVAVPDVLINDTYNGVPATLANVTLSLVSSSDPDVTLDPLNGSVSVKSGTPAGTYYLVYNITDKANPANSANATVTIHVTATTTAIIAINDNGSVNGFTGGVAVDNILINDIINGFPALLTNVTIDLISASAPNITLTTVTGSVSIAPNTPAGVYSLVYKITDKTNPTNTDEAIVAVTVNAPLINATNDAGTAIGFSGGTAVLNILTNDTYNNSPAALADVIITQLATTHMGVTVNPLTGSANVAATTPAGTYTIDYRITDKLNPTNFANAKVVITVLNPEIAPVNDEATIDGLTTITAISNILANDKVNGEQATLTNVTIGTITGLTNPNITVNPVMGTVDVAAGILPGIYTFNYEIFEIANPANRNPAEIKITVTGLTQIGIAKTVSAPQPEADGTYTLMYTIHVENLGNTQLNNISIEDDLKLTFPNPTSFRVIIGSTTATGSLVINPNYNGDSDIELLENSSALLATETGTVSFVVSVKLNETSGVFLNKAIAEAVGSTSVITTDESTDGTNPDPDGNNIPDENVPTPVVLNPITIYIPEGFSPNNDGVHDKFIIKTKAGDQVSLEVYNRWGNIVYKNPDYQNEWDGRSNQGIKLGEDLPDGTYFYIVILNGKDKFVRYITLKR